MIEPITGAVTVVLVSAIGAALSRIRRPSAEELRNRAVIDEMMRYQAASDRLRRLTIDTAKQIERAKR